MPLEENRPFVRRVRSPRLRSYHARVAREREERRQGMLAALRRGTAEQSADEQSEPVQRTLFQDNGR
jgi:hypothetical protein